MYCVYLRSYGNFSCFNQSDDQFKQWYNHHLFAFHAVYHYSSHTDHYLTLFFVVRLLIKFTFVYHVNVIVFMDNMHV